MSHSGPDSPSMIQYLGNSYSRLSSQQQSHVYEELLQRCHSLKVLRQERVVLPNEELPFGIPVNPGIDIKNYAMSPKHHSPVPKRKAVAISCEFGIAESRRNEPTSLCAIDCLTGETLISSLVAITQPMLDWRSNIHGIGLVEINAAMKSGDCLRGWRGARAKLLEHIDDQTILVGHNIRSPLGLLRLFHTKIVDTQVLATAAVFPKSIPILGKGRYKTPLAHVCSEFLGIVFRQGLVPEAGVRDVLENALATREIVVQCIQRPKDWEDWASQRRVMWGKTDDEEEMKPAAKNVYYKPSPSNHTSPSRLTNQDLAVNAAIDRYEAGYKAGFDSGFRMGYERALDTANAREKQPSTEMRDLDKSRHEHQPSHQELICFTEEESISGDQHEKASQRGSDEDSETLIAETGGLFAELIKDERIREMVEGAKHDEDRAINGDARSSTDLLEIAEQCDMPESKVEESRRRRILAKLMALGMWDKMDEDGSAQGP